MNHKVSTGQLFALLFVSRAVVNIGLNSRYLGGLPMEEGLCLYLASLLAGALLCVPVLVLHRRRPESSLPALLASSGPGRPVLWAALLVNFLLSGGASLGLFQLFLEDSVAPEFSVPAALALILAGAVLGAKLGLVPLCRCGQVTMVFLLGASLLLFAAAGTFFSPDNLEPLFPKGVSTTPSTLLLCLHRSLILPELALLLPGTRGRTGLPGVLWLGGEALFSGTLFFLLQGCLGRFGAGQEFPVYALSAITGAQALFFAIWLTGLVLKLGCGLTCCALCGEGLAGKRGRTAALFLSPAVMLALAIGSARLANMRAFLWDEKLLGLLLLPPVLAALVLLLRKKRMRKAVCLVLLSLVLLLPQWGCGSLREPYERIIVRVLGIDRSSGGGCVLSLRAGPSPGEAPEESFSVEGESLALALDALSRTTGRRPFFAHTSMVLFGESAASFGLAEDLDTLQRGMPDLRPSVGLYLAAQPEAGALLTPDDGEQQSLEELEGLGKSAWGQAMTVSLLDFVNALEREGSQPVLPLLRQEDGQIALGGIACFESDRFSHLLSDRAALGLLDLRGFFRERELLLRTPGGRASVELTGGSAQLEPLPNEQGEPPAFRLRLRVRGKLSGDDFSGEPDYPRLEKALSSRLSGELDALERGTLRRGCDSPGLGWLLYRKEPRRWFALAKDWEELLPKVRLEQEIWVTLERPAGPGGSEE